MTVPSHTSQVLVSAVNRAFVKQWIQKYPTSKPPKALVLVGPSGCGMSTLVHLCCKEEKREIVEMEASMYRSKKDIRHTVQDMLHLPLKRALVVEDPEAMVQDGGLSELVAFVRRRTRIPVIVICNNKRRPKIGTLLQAAEVVTFRYQPRKVVDTHFGRPCKSSDLRQASLATGGLQTERDYHMDVDESVQALMRGSDARSGLYHFASDEQGYVNLVHENYDVHGDISLAAQVAQDLSDADVLTDKAAFFTGCVLPGSRLRKAPAVLKKDKVWTKQTMVLSRSRGLKEAIPFFSQAGTALDVWSVPSVKAAMFCQAQSEQWGSVLGWAPEATVAQLMGVLRIGLADDAPALGRIRRGLKKHKDLTAVPDVQRLA